MDLDGWAANGLESLPQEAQDAQMLYSFVLLFVRILFFWQGFHFDVVVQ